MKITPIEPFMTSPAPINQPDEKFTAARRMSTPIWVFDIDNSRIAFANAAACALWNAQDEDELRSRNLGTDMSKTVEKRLLQYKNDFLESDATFTELWTLYPGGEPKSVMVIFRGYVLSDGRMGMQCEAISQAEDQPNNLRSAEALLHTDVMIALFGMTGPALYANPAARNACAGPNTTLAGLFADLQDYDTVIEQLDLIGEHRIVARINAASGLRWFDISTKACADAATGQPAILMTAVDVTELKDARDMARYLADRDQLTDLYNRTYLQHHVAKLASRFDDTECAIIFFDVDRFKTINDQFGHETGDEVLKSVASRIRGVLRPNDVAARLGGDEFVVILDSVRSTADMEELAKRLYNAISRKVELDTWSIDISVSIGATLFSPSQADFSEVLHKADIALYAAKRAGRGRITYFSEEMGAAAKERENAEFELRRAIEQREFILHYQPRLDLATGRIVSVEALVRWQHPVRGIVQPDDFIPLCEETGLIEELGRQVIEMGCRQAIGWKKQGLDIGVSINVSPRQFNDATLLDTLAGYAKLPGFPKGLVELEITESVLIGDHEKIAALLQNIVAMGYRIAIDDFGTGYSNLSLISGFPISCLKVDRFFIKDLPGSGPIISLIFALAQQIGAKVVSEGVETEAQMKWLRQQGCDEAQGYLISRPVSARKLNALLGLKGKPRPRIANPA